VEVGRYDTVGGGGIKKKKGVEDSFESSKRERAKFRVNQSEEWNPFANQALKFVLPDIP
jgi:hypothetical protein